jgi:iron(III) transport system substrate-binding protein
MNKVAINRFAASLLAAATLLATTASAAELNLYSARHYDTDEALYTDFTKATGITIKRIDGDADELLERIKLEGANSPADILITVDAGRLWRAEQAGVFAPFKSATLEQRIPANLRQKDGLYYAFSKRARVIVYARDGIDPALIQTYEDLAKPELAGKVCIRSSTNMYNLSLMASLIAEHDMAGAERWAKGVVANFARPPEGNDTAQIKAVAAGQCQVALVNSYYVARIMNSANSDDQAIAAKIATIFPNQNDRGTHINISGAGILEHAPHRHEAEQFLEYLASDQAQIYFANGNNEYAVVEDVKTNNPALEQLGSFKEDPLDVAKLGENQPLAQIVFDDAGWK